MEISFNKTKIVATIGPSSNTKENLRALIKTGVDVFRLNFSHGTHKEHLKVMKCVRELNKEMNINIPLLQDLQGPKIRVNEMEPNTKVEEGNDIVISTKSFIGNANRISTSYKHLPNDVKSGDSIMIDDGSILLKVISKHRDEIKCKVKFGGYIKSNKGINLPMTTVSASSMTEKDSKDLDFGLQNDIDWVALSFVRNGNDMLELRKRINKRNSFTRTIAKIERPEAVYNIDEIIVASDGIMIARGDLGVEMKMEDVPMLQKMIIEKCNAAAKPVIVATQMMESMITNPRPTRAEINDIANAVLDGTDAVMLSGETAVGKYPIKVVEYMVKTIDAVELSGKIFYRFIPTSPNASQDFIDSVILNACKLAKEVDAKAIVCMTQVGYNAYRVSSHRPNTKIFAFTNEKKILNSMNLVWGTRAFFYNKSKSTDDSISDIESILKTYDKIRPGDTVIFLASMPIHERLKTNTVKLHTIR